jgi:hypothetical protein
MTHIWPIHGHISKSIFNYICPLHKNFHLVTWHPQGENNKDFSLQRVRVMISLSTIYLWVYLTEEGVKPNIGISLNKTNCDAGYEHSYWAPRFLTLKRVSNREAASLHCDGAQVAKPEQTNDHHSQVWCDSKQAHVWHYARLWLWVVGRRTNDTI